MTMGSLASPKAWGPKRGALVKFTALIPARLASTRLPNKPLADIAGKPMVVRVAERAAASGAAAVLVACDDARIADACHAHGVKTVMTASHHASGSDRLAQACALLGLAGEEIVVNVQGDEPLIDPALIQRCAQVLAAQSDCVVSTVAHPITELADYTNPNIVKVVLDAANRALYFSRAPLPWWRDGQATIHSIRELPSPAPLRHLGLYAYRAAYLRSFPTLAPAPLEKAEALEQLRVLWHGQRIVVHVTPHATGPGVDTPEDLAEVRARFAAPDH
jgi:3-deoxy-manno-octulosonate cytidylyltransferase (CMP-KDO synthetase)